MLVKVCTVFRKCGIKFILLQKGYSLPGPFQWGYKTIDIAVDDL